jgi:ferredoxin-type protein NapF
MRPPAAVDERRFLELCDGCGKCIAACAEETAVLKADRGGGPWLDLQASFCTLCAACIEACPAGALDKAKAEQVALGEWFFPWVMRIDEKRCLEFRGITCRACEESCEAEAIRFRPLPGPVTQARIVADDCTGCGECLRACPEKAILTLERKTGE